MNILGLGGILSDAACALIKDGQLVAAAEERKIARASVPGDLPEASIAVVLALGKIVASEVDCVAVARPFSRDNETSFHLELRERFPNSRILIVEHHAAHAASAFYPSSFENATVLTLDRNGDFRSTAKWCGRGKELDIEEELYFPDSLGDLYGRVAELLGYTAGADEHKVQWLSTAGDDRFVDLFTDIIGSGAWPQFNREYFDRDRMSAGGFSRTFYERLEIADGEAVPDSLKAHVAAGLQRAIEAAVLRMTPQERSQVCIGGGLAMNVLLVSALEQRHDTFVQPAAGNAGTAIGAALHAWHVGYKQAQRVTLGDLCLGPSYTPEEIKQVLENCKLRFRYLLTTGELIDNAVDQLSDNKIVAWMQGRMEFGPRALGNRSILASPLNPYSSENLNVFIKHREPFRKFAASVIEEAAGEFFDVGANSRYLASMSRVKAAHRKTFAAAILGDELIRVQTVKQSDNPLFYSLLKEAGERTGIPVLYNTSFNLFHDPLVCSPRDAVRSFYSSGIDAMFVGHFLLEK